MIVEHDQFEYIVSTNWRPTRGTDLLKEDWVNCQKLKGPLKSLNTQWFVKTSDRVATVRQE